MMVTLTPTMPRSLQDLWQEEYHHGVSGSNAATVDYSPILSKVAQSIGTTEDANVVWVLVGNVFGVW
jgi:hypothetical protein